MYFIPFYRGNCKKGDYCNYEHQVDDDGRPGDKQDGTKWRFYCGIKQKNGRFLPQTGPHLPQTRVPFGFLNAILDVCEVL